MQITKRMRPIMEGKRAQCPQCLSELLLEADENYTWGGNEPNSIGYSQITVGCINCRGPVSFFVHLEEVPV